MKRKRNKGLFVGILLSAIAIAALGSTFFYRERNAQDEEEFTVVASFYPMYIAAENITWGRDHLRLESLSEPQTGCLHDYQLTPEDMKLLASADLFVVNGGGIEEFLTDVAKQYPDLVIVDASQGLDLLEDNGHAWMSVSLHRRQVENICRGLEKADPKYRDLYQRNAAAYDEKLAELEQRQQEISAMLDKEPVILFHEAYAYIAKDYGMSVSGVMDLDEERQVSAGEVAQVMDDINSGHVSVVLAEEQYGKEMGDMVEQETSASVFYLDTLVRGDYDSDSYLIRMEKNISIMREAAEAALAGE